MQGKEQVEQDECEMTKRRTGRKLRKAKGRMKVRNLVAKLQSREYDWMFGVDYQSTDESEWEEVISEGSGDERPGRTTRIKSQNPWQSHPPRYRAAHVQELFALLDTHRIEDQNKQLATQKKGAKYAMWVVGKPANRKLPLEDELKLRVYDPVEDSVDGADEAVVDPELLGVTSLDGASLDSNIDPALQNMSPVIHESPPPENEGTSEYSVHVSGRRDSELEYRFDLVLIYVSKWYGV
ncbi:hypothetical protein JB92DRAFT_1152567 [Gautieria morchelliformis]|nr:hypothetical protein JB92DRAFT_1152567 [Gautieria morchelliformis]